MATLQEYTTTSWDETDVRDWQSHESAHITFKQTWDVVDAVCFANTRGLIMNTEMTLDPQALKIWDLAGIYLGFTFFLARLNKWFTQRNLPVTYVYVWERSRQAKLHVHFALHVPPEHQGEFRRWAKITVQTLAFGQGRNAQQPFITMRRAATVQSQFAWLRYLLKGINPVSKVRNAEGEPVPFGKLIGVRMSNQGAVPFKRVGTARAISWGAQGKAGFRSLCEREPYTFERVWSEDYHRLYLAKQFDGQRLF